MITMEKAFIKQTMNQQGSQITWERKRSIFLNVVIFGCVPVCQTQANKSYNINNPSQPNSQLCRHVHEFANQPGLHIVLRVNQKHPIPLDAKH